MKLKDLQLYIPLGDVLTNWGAQRARCRECGVILDGTEQHAKGCPYPEQQAALARGMTEEEINEKYGCGLASTNKLTN